MSYYHNRRFPNVGNGGLIVGFGVPFLGGFFGSLVGQRAYPNYPPVPQPYPPYPMYPPYPPYPYGAYPYLR